MCGIFGIVEANNEKVKRHRLKTLVRNARSRGKDASGFLISENQNLSIHRSHEDIARLFKKLDFKRANIALGHSRLVTNGSDDNQPIFKNDCVLFHNGIIVNDSELWQEREGREFEIDSEIIIDLYQEAKNRNENAYDYICERAEGVISACILDIHLRKLVLLSNNGSLYFSQDMGGLVFSSEEGPLLEIGLQESRQLKGMIEFSLNNPIVSVLEKSYAPLNSSFIAKFKNNDKHAALLDYVQPVLQRCSRCILPETMPFIYFDDEGICNYCNNYTKRNNPKPLAELETLVAPYRKVDHVDCIVPFSGGRDSCMALHLIKKELNLNPITYTYDWGMVTDLGRRNISRFCASLGVENIIIAADIRKKRQYIKNNLIAWLKRPHLGMLSLLTAGDKFFFKYVEKIKRDTQVDLNIWGINPLEVTHFKAGFLGIRPSFMDEGVYISGWRKQLDYQKKRYLEYLKNPTYFNTSMLDALMGEYWRSVHKKSDYYHLFDYYKWDETEIDSVLDDYNWERAIDTQTSWRIGDGTAAFYNYVYYTVAGFTEHDTFRSNQIREGQLTRDEALFKVMEENKPRYENIQWYLDSVGVDYEMAIKIINDIPKLYKVGNEL